MLKIVVGDVEIRTDLELTPRQVHALITKAASIAVALGAADTEPVEEPRPPIGFSATIERLHEDILEEDISWYFEEE